MSAQITPNMPVTIVIFIITAVFSPTLLAEEFIVYQKNRQFVLDEKHVDQMDIKIGDIIYFANSDPGFHNIFSLSEIKTFDLGSYPNGESRPVLFNHAGTVEIECAIHPKMFLQVNVSH